MAAVLTCGPDVALSHESAAALWRIRRERTRTIHVSTPTDSDHRQPGIVAHRRSSLPDRDLTRHQGIPVTTPVLTLIDLATCISGRALEAAINEADKLDLVDPPSLRVELDVRRGQRGVRALRAILAAPASSSPTASSSGVSCASQSAPAGDPAARQRIPGRLLLAHSGPGRRD
jgi:hypothetical protein